MFINSLDNIDLNECLFNIVLLISLSIYILIINHKYYSLITNYYIIINSNLKLFIYYFLCKLIEK